MGFRARCEVYKKVSVYKTALVTLLKRIWADEMVPEEIAKAVFAVFAMLYKNKGSPNDPTKYRCIILLGHTYKALSHCMLARINAETGGGEESDDYLAD